MDILDAISNLPGIKEKQKVRNYEKTLNDFEKKICRARNKKRIISNCIDAVYSNIIALPFPFQHAKAAGFINIIKKQGVDIDDLCLGDGKDEMYSYLLYVSGQTPDFTEEFVLIKEKIREEKRKIRETLNNNRYFKIARILTLPYNRLNLKKYEKYIG